MAQATNYFPSQNVEVWYQKETNVQNAESNNNTKWIAPKKDKSKWNESDCSQWVGSLGEKYKQYIDVFVENAVDGDLLCAVNDEELKDIVSSGLHRRKILMFL